MQSFDTSKPRTGPTAQVQAPRKLLDDIFTNLHGAVGKTQVGKSLQALVDKELVTVKTYGKQSIYVAKQTAAVPVSAEDIEIADERIRQLRQTSEEQKEQLKSLNTQAAALSNSLTLNEIADKIDHYLVENKSNKLKIEALKSGSHRIDKAEMSQMKARHDQYFRKKKDLKRLCMDAVSSMTENLSKSPRELMEQLGMEMDKQDASGGAPKKMRK